MNKYTITISKDNTFKLNVEFNDGMNKSEYHGLVTRFKLVLNKYCIDWNVVSESSNTKLSVYLVSPKTLETIINLEFNPDAINLIKE